MSAKRRSFLGLTWEDDKQEWPEFTTHCFTTCIPLGGGYLLKASVTVNSRCPDGTCWWAVSKARSMHSELLTYGRTKTFSGAKQALKKALAKARLEG